MFLARLLSAFAAAAGLAAAQTGDKPPAKAEAQGVPALIDKVLADPADAGARERLRRAAEMALRQEKRAKVSEKAALLAGAQQDRKKVLTLRAAKEKRRRAWRKSLDRVCSQASSPDNIRLAVTGYEKLLESAPVYSDNREELAAGIERVKGVFFKTIKSEYPHLVEGRDRIDERDIASLLFSRAAAQGDYGEDYGADGTQEVLNKVDRFRRLERALGEQNSNLTRGLKLYSMRRYGEALDYFDAVLAFDRGNEEARFYQYLAQEKTEPEPDPAEK